MPAADFLDSNILVYTDDGGRPVKQGIAIELVARVRRARTGVVSVQVLQEYFAAATRKLGVDSVTARAKVRLFATLALPPTDADDVLAAIDLHRLHQLSIWDALIIRSAQRAGCRRLYSEDLQPGSRFDGVEIVNPFL